MNPVRSKGTHNELRPPSSTKLARMDRVIRALTSNSVSYPFDDPLFIEYPQFTSPSFGKVKDTALRNIIRDAAPSLSSQQEDILIEVAQLAARRLSQARGSRYLFKEQHREERLIKEWIDCARKMQRAQQALGAFVWINKAYNTEKSDRASTTTMEDGLPKNGQNDSWTAGAFAELSRDLRRCLEDITIVGPAILAKLRKGRAIKRPFDYEFVLLLAMTWNEFNIEPTVTRNDAMDPPQTPFQAFIKLATPDPPIGDDIVRGAVELFKTRRPREE
jgi:hypothetical protein